MSKKRKEDVAFNRIFTPKKRREYIDFDYLKKLSPEERKWLAKFTDEYYGADFEINDTYIKNGNKFVQVKGNKNKKEDKDLRTLRRETKYYKDENGEFTSDTEYKYSSANIHNTEELRTKCNKTVESLSRDLMSLSYKNENKSISKDTLDTSNTNINYGDHLIEDAGLAGFSSSAESELLLEEDINIELDIRNEDELEELVNPNYKKKRKRRQFKNLGKI